MTFSSDLQLCFCLICLCVCLIVCFARELKDQNRYSPNIGLSNASRARKSFHDVVLLLSFVLFSLLSKFLESDPRQSILSVHTG